MDNPLRSLLLFTNATRMTTAHSPPLPFQQIGASLVSTAMSYRPPGAAGQFLSRSPHQLHPHVDSAVERHAETPEPSLQQAAVGILQSVDNQTVLAWLTALRYESGCEHWFKPRPPSSQQRDAVSALKAYSDGLVLLWLDNARSGE